MVLSLKEHFDKFWQSKVLSNRTEVSFQSFNNFVIKDPLKLEYDHNISNHPGMESLL